MFLHAYMAQRKFLHQVEAVSKYVLTSLHPASFFHHHTPNLSHPPLPLASWRAESLRGALPPSFIRQTPRPASPCAV